MRRWWDNSVQNWAGAAFPLVVVSLVVWIAMTVVSTWNAVTEPSLWPTLIAVGACVLAVCWAAITVGVLRDRTRRRAQARQSGGVGTD